MHVNVATMNVLSETRSLLNLAASTNNTMLPYLHERQPKFVCQTLHIYIYIYIYTHIVLMADSLAAWQPGSLAAWQPGRLPGSVGQDGSLTGWLAC